MNCIAVSSEPRVARLRVDGLACDLTRDQEQELVERAKLDPREFAPLYERHFPRIYRFVFARVKDQAAAEDVTSEVFMKALKAMPRYQYLGRPFVAWLYRIALNAIKDRQRCGPQFQPFEELHHLSEEPPPDDLAANRDEMRRIWTLVATLPVDQQTALVLRFRDDLKIKEIAAVMGKSDGAVKLLVHRGVSRLRTEVEALRPAA